MQHFTTKTDVINHAIIPVLGDYAAEYDLDGLASATYEYNAERQRFEAIVFEQDAFNELLTAHELRLDVNWVGGGDDEYNATWDVVTEASGAIDGGAVQATEDEAESLANLDAALTVAGYRRGDRVSEKGDFETYQVAAI